MFIKTLAGTILAAVVLVTAPAYAEPWDVPMDVGVAIRDPDRFAWQLFIALTWPADIETRMPATSKAHGAEGPVMFETWALSDQVYLAGGVRPSDWEDLPWADPRVLSDRAVPRQIALFREEEPVLPGSAAHEQEEVRMNQATFGYIRENGLYSIEGQQRFYYDKTPVDFPVDAMEAKAAWRPISEAEKPRYHWTSMKDPKTGEMLVYGLTALHISSKVLPNWHWSTFEHIDNRFRSGIHDEGWLNPSSDSVACPRENLDCGKIPTGFGLEGTRWQNYRLRGSQVDYVDAMGNPTIIGNSELEIGFQQSASCMSCHRRATIGPSRNAAAPFTFGPDNKQHPPTVPTVMRLPGMTTLPDGQVVSFNGAPAPDTFKLPGQAPGGNETYLPLDFVWSLTEAKSERTPN